MKARQKRRVAAPTTGCWTKKASPCIEEKQRIRRPAVSHTQKKKNMYTYTDNSGQRRTRHHQRSGVCEWSLHVCASAGVLVLFRKNLYCARSSAGARTPWHKNTITHKQHWKHCQMSSNDRKPTLSLKHSISAFSHGKHAHSLKRWKPNKTIRRQGRQLVVGQRKRPVSTRIRELDDQL